MMESPAPPRETACGPDEGTGERTRARRAIGVLLAAALLIGVGFFFGGFFRFVDTVVGYQTPSPLAADGIVVLTGGAERIAGAVELITAGKVQEIKDAAAKSARESVEAATRTAAEEKRVLAEQNSQLTQSLNDHVIGNSFASSKFIAEKLAIPADIAQKVFADRLKVESGKLVPMDGNGNPLFSAVRHGEHADFEEAIEVYVSQYPNKDKILKSSGGTGGGAPNGKGDHSNQTKGNLGGTRQERSSAIASRFPELSGGA